MSRRTPRTAPPKPEPAPADDTAAAVPDCGPVAVLDGRPMTAAEWAAAWSVVDSVVADDEVWPGEPGRLVTYWRGLDFGATGCGYVTELRIGEHTEELGRAATLAAAEAAHAAHAVALAGSWAEFVLKGNDTTEDTAEDTTADPPPDPAAGADDDTVVVEPGAA